MQNPHPSNEQLAGYLDTPEAASQREVRHHLMACQRCRVRIDQLSQLEQDIKHYVPRFATPESIGEDSNQWVETIVDSRNYNEIGGSSQDIEQQIKPDPAALKTALHYALHSSAMNQALNPATPDKTDSRSVGNAATFGALHNWLSRIRQHLREPVPLWTMAPASLVLAIIIGFGIIFISGANNSGDQLMAFQDNPTITFQQPGAPAGSIGFFENAQVQRKPFDGLSIELDGDTNLVFSWPAVTNARQYKLEVFSIVGNDAQLVREQTSSTPYIALEDFSLSHKQHFQWQLSGRTKDNMIFTTRGDFLYVRKR